MRWIASLLVATILMCGWTSEASAERKLALVIGNDTYDQVTSLERAVADARAYRDALRDRRGFEVFYVENGDRAATNEAVFRFLGEIEPGDTAMVVYAGHGVQLDPNRRDTLFMLPTDIPNIDPGVAAEEAFFDANALSFAKLADWVQQRGAKLRIFVLDACRNNPFNRQTTGRAIGVSRGLGQVTSGEGEFIFYSAGPGQLALDRLPDGDDSPNSVFTRVFLDAFTEGAYLEDIANNVQARVRELARLARHEQTPYYSDGVPGKTCLDAACGTEFASTGGDDHAGDGGSESDASRRAREAELENTYWRFCETRDSIAYCDAYLAAFPDGPRALLAQLRRAEIEDLIRRGEVVPDASTGEPGSAGDGGDGSGDSGDDGTDYAAVDPTGDDGTDDAAHAREVAILRAAAWVPLSETWDAAALEHFIAEFPDTEEAIKAEARLAELRDDLAEGQRQLNRIGYGAGPVDGIWGRRSARALRRFQRAQGLDETGVLTEDLLARLKEAEPIPRTARPREPSPAPALPTPVPTPPPEVVITDPEPTPVPEPENRPGVFSGGAQRCTGDEGGPAFAQECE